MELLQKLEARKEDYLVMLEQNLQRQKLNEEQNLLLDKMIDSLQQRIDALKKPISSQFQLDSNA